MIVLIPLLFLTCDIAIVKSFHHRHRLYTNPSGVGEDSSENNTSPLFLQHLDHFDSTDLVLWKQVRQK